MTQLSRVWCAQFLTLCVNTFLTLADFPNSSNPLTGDPPIVLPGRFCASQDVFKNQLLDSYGEILSANINPNPCGAQLATGVVLRFRGQVQGRQFDRFGAVWVGGVEVLRTTTAEPTPRGIEWNVSRDISDYAVLFKDPQIVTLAIPNVVTSVYTGILNISVSFDFYADGGPPPSQVVSLLGFHDGVSDPFGAMSVVGSGWMNTTVPMLSNSTGRVFLDLYASGHGCEEFEAGFDCGVPLRKMRVLVDGQPAGMMYPTPVVYTGGINPLLWRPLTGLDSFDVPPYRFELTPFLPLFVSNTSNTLSITVERNTPQGVWFLDPVLVAVPGNDELVGGEVLAAELTGEINVSTLSNNTVFASDTSSLRVEASLDFASGGSRHVSLTGNFKAWANYTTQGSGGPTQPPPVRIVEGSSMGALLWQVEGSQETGSEFDFPYFIALNQSGGLASSSTFVKETRMFNGLQWVLTISSSTGTARYSTDVESNDASLSRVISTSSEGVCYNRSLSAVNGSVSKDAGKTYSCDPSERAVRGNSLPVWVASPAAFSAEVAVV